MNILIAGGGGFLGQILDRHFSNQGHSVVVLTRSRASREVWSPSEVWDGKTLGPWAALVDDADVVINLSGRSVDCRYTAANRRAIYASRLYSTRVLGEAISASAHPPRLWINASSATIYREAEDRAMDEATGELGDGFSVDVCRRWERTFFEAPVPPSVRRVALRTSIVLGRGGGALTPLRTLARLGLGGRQGSGRQYVSWLHEADFAGIVEHLIAHEDLEGAINVTAPSPLRNGAFMEAVRKAAGAPAGVSMPAWLVELGAMLIRTEPELVLKSRRVTPGRLQASGYAFLFRDAEAALADLLGRAPSPVNSECGEGTALGRTTGPVNYP